MIIVMILISAFACAFVFTYYGQGAMMITLPPYAVAVVGAIILKVMYSKRLNKKTLSEKEQKLKTETYDAEFNRLKSEYDKAQEELKMQLLALKMKFVNANKKKTDAESVYDKLSVEIDDFDQIPEFYKNKAHLEKIASYLNNGLADTIQSALVLFEQYRRAELLADLQRSEEERKKSSEILKAHNQAMVQKDYEDWKVDQEYGKIKSEISSNISKASDLYDEADSARRSRG